MKKNGIRVLVALLVLLAMGLVWGIAGATSQKPAWVRSEDSWDDRTKTLTINNELSLSLDHYYTNNEVSDIKHLVINYCNTSFDRYFNQWTNLESVTFNESTDFKKLQSNFSGCNTIKEVTFEKDVYIPNTKEYFANCAALQTVTFNGNDAKVSIVGSTFSGCTALTTVKFNNTGAIMLHGEVFMGCTSLTEITIPRGKTEDMGLFTDCTKLATVNIGKDVSSISSGTFIHCPALTKINVDPENTAYASDENGILFNKDKTTILAYPAGRTASSYVFPQSVNAIEDYAFHSCVHLTSITISSGVTSLPYEAFDYCTALASVEIPGTVTTIENWAFGDCTSLQSLTIPASVKSIGGAAFYDSGLTTLWVERKTPPTITDSTFDHCASLDAIIVPSAAVQDYQHAANWSAYEGKIKAYYDITYDLDGGTNSAANPDRYWSGSDNVTLTDPTREGYSFAGWTWDGQDEPVKTVTIPGAFTGDVAFTAYWIKPLTSQDISITIPEQTYTGSTLAPKVTVKDGSKELIAGTDYTISYQQGGKAVTEMKDAVDYDVVITGIGHYDGSVTKTFTISPKSINGAVVTLDKTQMTYNGEEQSVKVTGVVIDGLSLTSKDYTVSGNTGKKKDTYTVTVTGQGNYKDTATATWQIVEKAMTVSAENVTVPYDGQPHGITVIVTDPAEGAAVKYGTAEGIYDLEASPTISDAGTLTVYFKATAENYNDYTGFATVTVTAPPEPQKTDISKAKISAEDQEYTGKEIKPKLTVKLNGKKLKEKKDYTAAFKFNKDIGKATVTITGTGDYTGTATGSFLIIPKKVGSPKLTAEKGKKDALTLSWKAGKGIDGYEIEYGLKKDFKGAKKIKVKGAKNDEYEIKKLTAKKTYYVRIRAWKKAKGKMYYSAWSKTLSKKVK